MPTGRPKGTHNHTNHWKIAMRIEKAVRLEALNFSDKEIAEQIGMSIPTLNRFRKLPIYSRTRVEVASGVISEYDSIIKTDQEFIREKLRKAVPVALQTLYDAAVQRGNLRIAVEASKSILNRDGRFAEVSRIGLATEAQGGVASKQDNEMASALASALAKQKQVQVEVTTPTINSEPITTEVQ